MFSKSKINEPASKSGEESGTVSSSAPSSPTPSAPAPGEFKASSAPDTRAFISSVPRNVRRSGGSSIPKKEKCMTGSITLP